MSSSPANSSVRLRDLIHPIVAALISVIVNYGGTFILVFQAAKVAGLSPELTASWVWSVSIGVGVTGLLLSWVAREPIITAWSTPAAAFLVVALATTPYAEAVGAYMISGAAFVLLGVSGYFEKVIRLIPPGVAAGLLAGILLQFGIGAFGGMSVEPTLVGVLIVAYLLLKRFTARYAVVGVLALGLVVLLIQGRFDVSGLGLQFAAPVFTRPEFSLNALLSVALPLFLITLTGQYMPGMLVLRNDGFRTSANPIVALTGLGSLLMAPFGSHAFNIAAITAAICTGKEAHEEPSKRWIAGIRRRRVLYSGGDFRRDPRRGVHGLPGRLHHNPGRARPAGHPRRQPGRRHGRRQIPRSRADNLPGGCRQHYRVRHRRGVLGVVDRAGGVCRAQRPLATSRGGFRCCANARVK